MVETPTPQDQAAYVPADVPLRELAEQHGLHIGAAVSAHPLRQEPAYALAVTHEFNMLTTENAAKFGPIHPQPDRYAFADADTIVDLAAAHDMLVRGHTLVWHRQLPSWVENGDWTRDELLAVLREHIHTIVGRYQGRIAAWDVVNEAIDGREMRDTIWQRVIGPEYVDLAFRWAHEADPDALLFYNDYGGEGMNKKSDAIYDLVKGMQDRGVPIHGVGLQMHVTAGGQPPAENLRRNIERLSALGLQVHITELDVRISGEPTPAKLQQQADTYRQVLDVCLETPGCKAVVLWGFTDRYSWIPGAFKGYGSALIFDESYRPKPAYQALHEVLARQPNE